MGKINNKLHTELQQMFGSRVSFRKLERKLYGHDIAAVPGLIKPLIGKTIPDAVVQPQTEEELVELVRQSAANKVPLAAARRLSLPGIFTSHLSMTSMVW